MSCSRPKKRKVEMIESYWTGGEYGSNYVWDDNHGELVRCKDCKNSGLDSSGINGYWCPAHTEWHDGDWFCADGARKEGR